MHKSPAPDRQIIDKGTGKEQDEPKYRSIVDKAMCVVTKMLIKAANTVQELTKFYKKPKKGQWEALAYLARYLN